MDYKTLKNAIFTDKIIDYFCDLTDNVIETYNMT